ncbi:hypothetical protein C8Q76DRAFT_203656 [Earliella scabrosa]|nr:hypothetical protein C8Q76DRAFT_203656 [Earliella scabrosa]
MATNGLLSPSGLPPGIMRAQSSASSTSSNSSNSSSGGHKNAWSRAPSTRSLSPLEAPSGSSTSSSDGPLTPTTSEPIGRIVLVKDNVEDALAALTLDGDEDFGEDDVYFSVADDASVTGDPQSDSLWDAPPADYAVSNGVKVEESLWGDYEPQDDPESDEDDDRALVKAAEKEPELCRIHNVVCKKGICKVYAAQLRDQKRREREEERKKEREAALARRNKKTDKKGSFFKDAPSSNGGSTPATARAPPAHLRLGAAAPASAGVPRSLPGHLRRGASSDPASGRTTPTPAQPQDIDVDDARSETSSGVWDAASAGPWGPSGGARAPPSNTGATINTNGASAPKAWGTWGRAPSVSASSVLRNNDSWSVSARSAGGPGATGDGTNGEDNQDAQSVSGRSATGWGTGSDGPWGSSEAVRQAGKGKGARSKTKAKTQDEVDEFDVRSVAGSSASWGNVSAGIW